ncbi:Pimeloyl-ACP methyl ester carboxylesterase [Asanoa hainanensis]|uniref:Pimeloyl-ACP methyl ester carboxylesterase n=1 Tax=Asanoa hainanensis TaxID=560556 RepID=A0A239LMV0_9ACTN|nr:Pimeloyl-ACP methyl ester carboxylesterase [Asanoa hainanensis]
MRDLAALLEVVGPAVLVGHSWGGLLAELTTLARPDRVVGLVLVDPYHEEMAAAVPRALRAASSAMLAGMVLSKVVGLFPRIAAGMGRSLAERCTPDPGVQTLLVDAYLASYATLAQVAAIGAENRLGDSSVREVRAARVAGTAPDIPMRILTASTGKPPKLQELARELAERSAATFPRGKHVVVSESGHYIHKDQPAAVLAAIEAVIEQ